MNAMKRLIDVSMFLRGMLGRRSMQLQQITETKDTSSFPICEAVFKNESGEPLMSSAGVPALLLYF